MKYEEIVKESLDFMGTTSKEWSALEIKGYIESEGYKLPVYDFPKGYNSAQSKFKSNASNMCCELCGHDIKTAYYIKNDSKKWLLIVGSECVTTFSSDNKSGIVLLKENATKSNKEKIIYYKEWFRKYNTEFTYVSNRGYGRKELCYKDSELNNFNIQKKILLMKKKISKINIETRFHEESSPKAITGWINKNSVEMNFLIDYFKDYIK